MPEATLELAARPARMPSLPELSGLIAAFVVEPRRGDVSGRAEQHGIDYELDALHSEEVLRLAERAIAAAVPGERLGSMVFVLGEQQHVLVPSRGAGGRYLYLVLERSATNLGLLLHHLANAGF